MATVEETATTTTTATPISALKALDATTLDNIELNGHAVNGKGEDIAVTEKNLEDKAVSGVVDVDVANAGDAPPLEELHSKDSTDTLVEESILAVDIVQEVIKQDTKVVDIKDDTPVVPVDIPETQDVPAPVNDTESHPEAGSSDLAAADTTSTAEVIVAVAPPPTTAEPQVDVSSLSVEDSVPTDKQVETQAVTDPVPSQPNVDATQEAKIPEELTTVVLSAATETPTIEEAITEPAQVQDANDKDSEPETTSATPTTTTEDLVDPSTTATTEASPVIANQTPGEAEDHRIGTIANLVLLSDSKDETCFDMPDISEDVVSAADGFIDDPAFREGTLTVSEKAEEIVPVDQTLAAGDDLPAAEAEESAEAQKAVVVAGSKEGTETIEAVTENVSSADGGESIPEVDLAPATESQSAPAVVTESSTVEIEAEPMVTKATPEVEAAAPIVVEEPVIEVEVVDAAAEIVDEAIQQTTEVEVEDEDHPVDITVVAPSPRNVDEAPLLDETVVDAKVEAIQNVAVADDDNDAAPPPAEETKVEAEAQPTEVSAAADEQPVVEESAEPVATAEETDASTPTIAVVEEPPVEEVVREAIADEATESKPSEEIVPASTTTTEPESVPTDDVLTSAVLAATSEPEAVPELLVTEVEKEKEEDVPTVTPDNEKAPTADELAGVPVIDEEPQLVLHAVAVDDAEQAAAGAPVVEEVASSPIAVHEPEGEVSVAVIEPQESVEAEDVKPETSHTHQVEAVDADDVKALDISVTEDFDEASAPVVELQTTPQIAITTDQGHASTAVNPPEETETEPTEQEEEIERPKSPWTPSYSVITQGRSVADDVKELDEPEAQPEPEPVVVLADTTQTVVVVEETPVEAQPEIVEPEVPVVEETKDVAEEDDVKPLESHDTKSVNWPVSYSVSSQGASPLHTPKATDDTEVTFIEPLSQPTEAAILVEEVPSVSDAVPEEIVAEEAAPVPTVVELVVPPTEAEVIDDVVAEDQHEVESPVPELLVEGNATEVVDETPASAAASDPIERPWTPSYSVTRQGSSPLHSPKELEEEEEVEAQPVESPWTPSYSVTHQGTSPLLTSQKLPDESLIVEAEPTPEVVVVEEPSVADREAVSHDQLLQDVAPAVVINAETVDPEQTSEHSKELAIADAETSPQPTWTPSYSVNQQGSSPLGTPVVQAKELPVESVPTVPIAVVDAPQILLAPVPNGNGDVVATTDQPDVAESAPVQPAINVNGEADKVDEDEKPEDKAGVSWTPSYSVITQGSRSHTPEPEESHPTENAKESLSKDDEAPNSAPQPFPTAEPSSSSSKISTKPSLARLAPVKENEAIDAASPADLATETLPSSSATVSPRTRLESTASSRYFPGGWFTSRPKSPDETRTSLDHAAGVFSKGSAAAGDTSPAIEAPANTPIDGIDERKSKSRWCVVM